MMVVILLAKCSSKRRWETPHFITHQKQVGEWPVNVKNPEAMIEGHVQFHTADGAIQHPEGPQTLPTRPCLEKSDSAKWRVHGHNPRNGIDQTRKSSVSLVSGEG